MSNNTTNMSMIATIGAATAGTIVGVTAILLAQKNEKQKLKEAKMQRYRARKKKFLE